MGVSMFFFATDIQLIPVRKIGLKIQGFPNIVFATGYTTDTSQKDIYFYN